MMNIIPEKILVVSDSETKSTIFNSLNNISGLEILEADSENKAFELIYNHFFVLVIIDETLPHIDLYKIGSMLLSHKNTNNSPLLIATNTIEPEKFLNDFKALHIDYIQKPFTPELIRSKIKIFYELFKQKNAVAQSIDELDKAYKKIVEQHELVIKEEFSRKDLLNKSTVAANQIQQPLQSLQSSLYKILKNKSINPEIKSNLATIKASSERLSYITKSLMAFPGRAKRILADHAESKNADQVYKILYAQAFSDEFSIFHHFLRGVIKCELVQATTVDDAMNLIGNNSFDLIFIDHTLPENGGFNLLSQLSRMKLDVPIIYTIDKQKSDSGPTAMSKGAFTYFVKEEITSANILTLIYSTLEKAKITREVADAQNNIVMISRKDYLTKLFNRRCFEEALDTETSKSKRYKTPLSILIVDFDNFKSINETHGYNSGDIILSTSASIIQSMVRNNDVVCRYGGEEFGVVLPNTVTIGAKILAERIRKKIDTHKFEFNSKSAKLTVSIGIATFDHETDNSYSPLVKRALDSLTLAMENGGNKTKSA